MIEIIRAGLEGRSIKDVFKLYLFSLAILLPILIILLGLVGGNAIFLVPVVVTLFVGWQYYIRFRNARITCEDANQINSKPRITATPAIHNPRWPFLSLPLMVQTLVVAIIILGIALTTTWLLIAELNIKSPARLLDGKVLERYDHTIYLEISDVRIGQVLEIYEERQAIPNIKGRGQKYLYYTSDKCARVRIIELISDKNAIARIEETFDAVGIPDPVPQPERVKPYYFAN